MYGEDGDLALRAAGRGLRPVITPDAVITHEVGVSSATAVRQGHPAAHRQGDPASQALAAVQAWHRSRALCRSASPFGPGGAVLASRGEVSPWIPVWKARRSWLPGYAHARERRPRRRCPACRAASRFREADEHRRDSAPARVGVCDELGSAGPDHALHLRPRRDPRAARLRRRRDGARVRDLHRRVRGAGARNRDRPAEEPRQGAPGLGLLAQSRVEPGLRGHHVSDGRLVGARERPARARERHQGPFADDRPLESERRPALRARAADGLQEPCHPSERRGAHQRGSGDCARR